MKKATALSRHCQGLRRGLIDSCPQPRDLPISLVQCLVARLYQWAVLERLGCLPDRLIAEMHFARRQPEIVQVAQQTQPAASRPVEEFLGRPIGLRTAIGMIRRNE